MNEDLYVQCINCGVTACTNCVWENDGVENVPDDHDSCGHKEPELHEGPYGTGHSTGNLSIEDDQHQLFSEELGAVSQAENDGMSTMNVQ
ncbi:hypothetical protein SLS58_008521 [Diplodia intermedia]|uniref:B box-type domain-containing protein n=1 Tax=Diplodia intermedia TaxID=856260 RepID=A0ABR3THA1_9PEZI